jgi:hypothetical protein
LFWFNPRFFSQTRNSKKTTDGDSQHLQLTNQLANQLTNQPANELTNQPTNELTNQLANQLINELTNQLTNELTNQLINNSRVSKETTTQNSPTQPHKKVKTTGRYKIGLYGGISCGIFALTLQLFISIPSDIEQYTQKQQITQETEREKTQLQAETAIHTETAKQQKLQADSYTLARNQPRQKLRHLGLHRQPQKPTPHRL